MSSSPLMPKATAVWLIENTGLTFKQIATFCHLHSLEVQTIADTDTANSIIGFDPIAAGQLNWDEIHRCEADHNSILEINEPTPIDNLLSKKRNKYTPLSKRQDRPDAIAWLLKYHPQLSDNQVCCLVSSTKPTVVAIRNRSHWNADNIKPKSPVYLGFCSQEELDAALQKIKTEE